MYSTKSISSATSTTIRATTATSTRTTTLKRPSEGRFGSAVLAATAVWSLFAFGGAYTWTEIPIIAAAIGLTIVVRPRIAGRGTRTLDVALVACLAVVALQLVPAPQDLRLALSPSLVHVERTLYLAEASPATRRRAPLTIDPAATIESGAVALAVVLMFWCARALFDGSAERWTIRRISVAGLAASAIGIVQHATSPTLLYWTLHPLDPSARPFSPFVNRNDFAGWLVLAIPLTIGYLIARIEARRTLARRTMTAAVDDAGVWLAGSACLMSGALVALLSRSGLIAGLGGTSTFVALARARPGGLSGANHRLSRWALAAGVGGVAVVALAFFNAEAMTPRIADALNNGLAGRRDIWTLTMTMIRDFWRSGVGVGAFARAMSAYQPPHDFAFNHAHNEYLQILAEGGVPLAIGVAIVMTAGIIEAVRRLRADRSPLYWIRVGALSGLAATAIQSVWETAVRMPANAVLFALVAAIALRGSSEAAAGPARSAP